MKKLLFVLIILLIPNTSWAWFIPTCENTLGEALCDVYESPISGPVAHATSRSVFVYGMPVLIFLPGLQYLIMYSSGVVVAAPVYVGEKTIKGIAYLGKGIGELF